MVQFLDRIWLPLMNDVCVKSVLLLAVVYALTLFIRRSSASLRHLIWLVTLAGLWGLPFLFTAPPKMEGPRWLRTVDIAPPPSEPSVFVSPGYVTRETNLRSWNEPTGLSAVVIPSALPAPKPVVQHSGITPRQLWAAIAFSVWLAGVLFVFLRTAGGLLRIRWIRQQCERETEAPILECAEAAARAMGLKGRMLYLRGLADRGPTTPMTWGLVRPVVALPAAAANWPADRLQAILLHELAHVRRRDWLFQLFGYVTCAVYWFNPLVWLAVSEMKKESERACDDYVLMTGVQAPDYAAHLLEIVRAMRAPRTAFGAAVTMAQGPKIESRLRDILSRKRRRNAATRGAAAVSLLVASALLIPLGFMRPPQDDLAYALRHLPSPYTMMTASQTAELSAAIGRARPDDPMASEAYYRLGMAQYDSGHQDQALQSFRHSLAITPKFNLSNTHLHALQKELMILENARQNHEALVVVDKIENMTIGPLGVNNEDDRSYYENELQTAKADALSIKARILTRLTPGQGGGPLAAAAVYRQFLQQAKTNHTMPWISRRSEALSGLADALRDGGKPEAAIAAYTENLHHSASMTDSLNILLERAKLQYKTPFLPPSYLEGLLSKFSSDQDAKRTLLYDLGESYLDKDDYKRAAALFQQLWDAPLDTQPYSQDAVLRPGIGNQLAMALDREGRTQESNRVLQQIIQRYPASQEAKEVQEQLGIVSSGASASVSPAAPGTVTAVAGMALLPGGVQVKLTGITLGDGSPGVSRSFWGLDGRPRTSTVDLKRLAITQVPGSEIRDIVFQITHTEPGSADTSTQYLAPGVNGGETSVTNAVRSGKVTETRVIYAYRRRLPPSVDIRYGIALGSWQTVAAVGTKLGAVTDSHGQEVLFGSSTTERTEMDIHGHEHRVDWFSVTDHLPSAARRVVAITAHGKVVPLEILGTDRSSGKNPEFTNIETIVRMPKTPIAGIQKFELQMRPYQWVEFDNVPLRPAGK